ncbi:MAG: hypothetical protein ACRD0W_00135 [Acidimicrobiales bacterium]
MSEFGQPDRRRHPDGIHRDYWTRPIYFTPDDPDAKAKCGWADETGRHGCGAHVQGRPYQRVTTFVGVLEDTFRLEQWAKRTVAIGLAMNDHLLLKVASQINPDDPHENRDALNKICEEAATAAKASAGAEAGTALHGLTERLDRGERAAVPKQVAADIEAYRQLIEVYALDWADIEVPTVIDGIRPTKTAYGVGGRFDRITDHWADPASPWPCPMCGKGRRVVDLKTQKSMEWGPLKTAMQLAAYAIAKRYDPSTGERGDLDVCQCRGYVLHLPVGKGRAELHRADLVKARRRLATAYEVWQARQEDGLLIPVELTDSATSAAPPPASPDPQASESPDIHGLIAIAGDRAALAALYEQFNGNGWAYGHTLAGSRRLAELEARS